MTGLAISYPRFNEALRGLVREHLKIKDEPLRMAVYYAPERDEGDVFLFEVIEGFGANEIDADRELFEVTYSATAGFPLEPGQALHLVLTNPREYEVAVKEGWRLAEEFRAAAAAGRSQRIHIEPGFEHLAEMVHA
jgi:hypothetical protein